MLKIAVIGSRSFQDYDLVKKILDRYYTTTPEMLIISGGAIGADSLAEKYADEHNLKKMIFKPDWKTHGRAAGHIRNTDIVKNADIVIAFWDGESRGTLDSIKKAKKLNKILKEIRYKEL